MPPPSVTRLTSTGSNVAPALLLQMLLLQPLALTVLDSAVAEQRLGVGVGDDGVDPALGAHHAQAVLALQEVVERVVFQPGAVQTGGQVGRHGRLHQQAQFARR